MPIDTGGLDRRFVPKIRCSHHVKLQFLHLIFAIVLLKNAIETGDGRGYFYSRSIISNERRSSRQSSFRKVYLLNNQPLFFADDTQYTRIEYQRVQDKR